MYLKFDCGRREFMTRKELYENKLQMDYFSDDYIRFEEYF